MTERSPYTLDAVQLENAVQALQEAAETFRPSPSEQRMYRVLGICVRVAVAAFVGIILVTIIFWAGLKTDGYLFQAIHIERFLVIVFLLAAVVALAFLLLNQSVVRQAFRQRRLLKKLGIREVSLSAWRIERRGYSWSRLAEAVLTGAGILGLILGVFAWISREKEDVSPVWAIVTLFAFGGTVLLWRFVQRSREQWAIVADANRLRSALESMRTKAGAGEAVAIPAAVLEDVAEIERVAHAFEQRDAVVASAGATKRGYGVFVARGLSPREALLDPKQRVAVEDLIDDLSANPRPAGVEPTAEGLLSVRTPEEDVELQYSIDEGARRVHIVALGPTGVPGSPTTDDHG
jgi:hypothetical protein